MDELILVDERDTVLGYGEKLRVHQNGGQLHRAFSIFIYNSAHQTLLQQRSVRKYHFGGLWSNACCSHPRRGEQLLAAAHQRLQLELGIDAQLQPVDAFLYRAEDPVSGLVEHELDHILVGLFDGEPSPHADEVDNWKWMGLPELMRDLAEHPNRYTPWFPIALSRLHGSEASLPAAFRGPT